MSDDPFPDFPADAPAAPQASPSPFATRTDPVPTLRQAVAQVMAIQDVTLGDGDSPVRFRGRLLVPADEAFRTLRPQFEATGHTPQLRREDGLEVVRALPGVYHGEPHGIPWLNIGLLLATIVSVFYVGMQSELYVGVIPIIMNLITGHPPAGIPADLIPSSAELAHAAGQGALYAAALLGILGSHEMGHYIVARRHKVYTTWPFFIPMPLRGSVLGTLGAVIAMREPAPNRRIQFDIGIAGPLAGLVVAIPLMIIGLRMSEVQTFAEVMNGIPASIRGQVAYVQEGQSLAYLGLKYLVFGRVLPSGGTDVFLSPVAFAAWAGLLVTALNLLPVGQLDGGHVLYGLFGHRAQAARWPIIGVLIVLTVAGILNDQGITNLPFGWSGWWLWVLLLIFLARNHAPVLDEITELDPPRRALGVATLIIFVLIFTPRPLMLSAGPLSAVLHWLA